MLTYNECQEKIKRGRNGTKKLGNNTYLHKMLDGSFGVKLHDTFVVIIHANGNYTLNSGGWETVTTKKRINEYGPVNIYQRQGIWYLSNSSVEFYDGMVLSPVDGEYRTVA